MNSLSEEDRVKFELRKSLRESSRPPKQKNPWAMTAAQDYGWYAEEAKRDRKYVNPKKTCAETRYATAYVRAMGKSPYATK